MKRSSFVVVVAESTQRDGKLTMRIFDPAKGRLAAGSAADALSAAFERIGAQIGAPVRITVSLCQDAGDGGAP